MRRIIFTILLMCIAFPAQAADLTQVSTETLGRAVLRLDTRNFDDYTPHICMGGLDTSPTTETEVDLCLSQIKLELSRRARRGDSYAGVILDYYFDDTPKVRIVP